MKCPTDDSVLVMTDRSGIEIDYCPQCRGVWLDRGELDKLIERASIAAVPQASAQPQSGYPAANDWSRGRSDDGRAQSHDGYSDGRKRKKENWLSELFD